MKRWLVLVLLGVIAWSAYLWSHMSITVNGQTLSAPAQIAAAGGGTGVALAALFLAAGLLVFFSAAIGVAAVGILALAAAWLVFPLMLPLAIPLLIMCLVFAAVRGRHKREPR